MPGYVFCSSRGFASSAAAEPARATSHVELPDVERPSKLAPESAAIDVASYVQDNYTPFYGDSSFLAGA